MQLVCEAFLNEGEIPEVYTCDGDNIHPPLKILGVPEGARSLVLVMDDPDVPKTLRPDGMFDHWLVWNIPPETTFIPEGEEPQGVVGNNTRGNRGYTGPCPPDREHRYFFKLYALDRKLDLPQSSSKQELEESMQGAILAECSLMGRYNRPQNR